MATALQEGDGKVSFWGLAQLGISTVMFLLAAMAAKQWGMAPSSAKLLLTLALYTAGNLIMLRLVREFGMSVSFSLSAVIQLVSVNVVALAFFGERLNALQATGMVLAIADHTRALYAAAVKRVAILQIRSTRFRFLILRMSLS